MRKIFLMLAALAALVSPLVITSTADAATPRQYVSRTEFGAIHKNYSKARVHKIFGDYGRKYTGVQSWYYGEIDAEWCAEGDHWACATQTREYHTKSRWGSVSVDYYRDSQGVWRVDHKSAYWG